MSQGYEADAAAYESAQAYWSDALHERPKVIFPKESSSSSVNMFVGRYFLALLYAVALRSAIEADVCVFVEEIYAITLAVLDRSISRSSTPRSPNKSVGSVKLLRSKTRYSLICTCFRDLQG